MHNLPSEKGENFNLGGEIASVQIIDSSKEHYAHPMHRALRHHTQGIFEAERVFGVTIQNSAGRDIPVCWIGEQHVKEDCRMIPSLADWYARIEPAPWMANGQILAKAEKLTDDPKVAWQKSVAVGDTVLGLHDWIAHHDAITAQSASKCAA